jgi:hypothetical protein
MTTEIDKRINEFMSSMDKRFEAYREEDKIAREEHREDMLAVVDKKIDVKVNGKIDKLNAQVTEVIAETKKQSEQLTILVKRVDPMAKRYETGLTVWGWVISKSKVLAIIAGILAAGAIILSNIRDLILK